MYSGALSAAASMIDLWGGMIQAQSKATEAAVRAAKDKQECKSWYRHPDSADFGVGSWAVGSGGWWGNMPSTPHPFLALSGMAALWSPWMRDMTSPVVAFNTLSRHFDPFGLARTAEMFSVAQPGLGRALPQTMDVFNPFATFRSAGGHAMAQVFMQPELETMIADSFPAMRFGQAPFGFWPVDWLKR